MLRRGRCHRAGVLVAALVLLGCSSPATCGGGISQLVDTRNGHTSVRGFVITLDRLTFKQMISPEEISVVESKHNAALAGTMMEWTVASGGKRLVIEFKPGMGDFGTGNGATVYIKRSAFVDAGGSPNGVFTWALDTDPM